MARFFIDGIMTSMHDPEVVLDNNKRISEYRPRKIEGKIVYEQYINGEWMEIMGKSTFDQEPPVKMRAYCEPSDANECNAPFVVLFDIQTDGSINYIET